SSFCLLSDLALPFSVSCLLSVVGCQQCLLATDNWQLILLGRLLLVGHGLALALAGAGVGTCALATHRKSCAMAKATVAADIHQAFDAQLHFTAQRTFHLYVLVDVLANTCLFIVGPFLHLCLGVHFGLFKDLEGPATADAVDVGKADVAPLVLW